MVLERNPNFPGEPYPGAGRAGGSSRGSAGRCRQAHALHRPRGVLAGEGKHPLLEQVPAGLLRRLRDHVRHLRPGHPGHRQRRRAAHARPCRSRASSCRPRSPPASCTWASTCSTRWSAGTPSARASCARRSPSRIDQEEFISIFLNGRGIAAQGPIPPGIFGYREGEAGHRPLRVRLGRRRAAPQVGRGRQAAAGRGRLPQRHRPRDAASR